MKNKKLVYYLLPLVVIIWGVIIYKVVKSIDEPVSKGREVIVVEKKKPTTKLEDTFQLILNYRDPFLGIRTNPEKLRERQVKPSISAKVNPPKVPWPSIEYFGVVENKSQKGKIALIRIGDRNYFMKEKEENGGIKLNTILDDSIKVSFGKSIKYVAKGRAASNVRSN